MQHDRRLSPPPGLSEKQPRYTVIQLHAIQLQIGTNALPTTLSQTFQLKCTPHIKDQGRIFRVLDYN